MARPPSGASGSAPSSLRRARRSEALAGYAMISVPMLLFLVLKIGTVFYAVYISLWRWNVRSGPVTFKGLGELPDGPRRSDLPARGPELALLRGRLGAADDGDRAVPGGDRQPEDPRPDVLPGAPTTSRRSRARPRSRSCGSSSSSPVRPVQQRAGGDRPRTRCSSCSAIAPNQNWIGDQDTALNSVIILNAWTTSGTFMLFYLASLQIDQRRGLRGGRDRRRRRPGRRSGGSPSRCSGRATTSWPRSRSSGRSSCSTRRSSPAARTATRTTP